MDGKSALSGAGGGAAAGAALGSVVPGIGTAIGAIGGAIFGGLMGGLNKRPKPQGPTEQEKALSQWGAAQRADYLARFRPREDSLIRYATDASQPLKSAEAAKSTTAAQYADAPDRIARNLDRMGVKATAEQTAGIARRSKLQSGLASVDAMNRSSQATYDRQTQILGAL